MFSGEKLSYHMKEKKFTNKQLAETLNNMGIEIKEDSFKGYRQGRSNPRMEVLCGIAEALGIREQDLFNGERESSSKMRRATTNFNEVNFNESVVRIPVFLEGTYTQNIHDLISGENVYIEVDLLKNYHNHRNIIAIKITSDTEETQTRNNNICLIELMKEKDFSKIDGVYLVRYGNIIQIKKVQFLGNNEIKLISLNSSYPPLNPKDEVGEDWEILGKPFMRLNIEYYNNVQYLDNSPKKD